MATLEPGDAASISPWLPASAIHLPRLRWMQILAISIFWFALNFHWAALLIIILPNQILHIAGNAYKGEALAFVLIPGAFVSLFANPLFGLLSDRTRGWLASWGRRRPYILLGTLVNVGGLVWMALSRDLVSLTVAFIIVQFSSNAAQAPFHALLPDIVPVEQRGLTSGIMGLLSTAGNIGGVIVAGILIASSAQSFAIYQQGLWLAYTVIIIVLLVLMLITIFSVHEERGVSAQLAALEATQSATPRRPWSWLKRSTVITIAGTVAAIGLVWGALALWNALRVDGLSISSDVQLVVVELIATIGLLRLFDFNPRRDPDFAWVFVTRLVMMLGIYTIQTFLQYYMRDAVGVPDFVQQTTNFVIILSLTTLISAIPGGWLSDHFGRKRMIYISGGFLAAVGLIFIFTHWLPIVLAAGAIFGIGYGAYISVDWALVADVLPSQKNYARDMGVWNIALSLPQVIAPVLGGPLIDHFVGIHQAVLGYQLLFAMAIIYCVIGTITVRYIRGVKR